MRNFVMRTLIFFAAMQLSLSAPVMAGEDAQQRCDAIAVEPGTTLKATAVIADREDLLPFCQVQGTIAGRIKFALRMPVENWNGKFVVAGCGGFCGSLLPEKPGHSNSINEALKLGYAAITTDGGHEAESWDTDWAMQDPPALDLYAGAWMPQAVNTGREIVQRFYAAQPRRTYFSGCSNGGRLALMAAQRYPALFDGIAGGGGIFDLTGNAGVHGLWLLQTTRDKNGAAVIARSKVPLLQREVMAQCDSLDGVVDGVVSRPDLCQPQLSGLQCNAQTGDDCFSETELAAIARLYQGATVDGVQIYSGIPPGSEALWPIWVTGTDEDAAWGERAAEGNLRLTYGIPSNEAFNPHDYVLADELENLQRLAPILNATDPDLSAFAATGGKLLYYHGLADPLILPGRAQQYYEEAVAVQGKEKLDEFARFVMVPGQGHCWEKPGQVADDFNPLVVIDQWVESGRAPNHVIAVQKDAAGTILRSRKLCSLPQIARLRGGDQTQAERYECIDP
jgi:pimeloyl-ACP methyl ester carboxylesterase